jgi:anti-sigma B factor antagonist
VSTPFDVTIEERGDTAHVTLIGELDISTAPRLEEDLRRVEAGSPQVLVLDLSKLTFMDSTGLRLLIGADARARDAGPPRRRLVIVQGNEMVQRVLRVTRMDERLEIVSDPGALREPRPGRRLAPGRGRGPSRTTRG